jgi:hypothetical protein
MFLGKKQFFHILPIDGGYYIARPCSKYFTPNEIKPPKNNFYTKISIALDI